MKFNKNFLKSTNLGLIIIIIIGILVVLNFFSYQIFYRWDLTQNKDYSISDVSKKTIKGLNDIVNIKAYFSQDLPTQFITLRQEVGDILDEYVSYSGGKIKVEFIDPKKDEETQQELYSYGIPLLQFNALENDKYQVVNGYLGMQINYGSKSETIPVVQDTSNLEYQITSNIKKVISQQLAVVGFWQGNGAADTQQGISIAYKKLNELYDVRLINFAEEKKIPAEINTLIIVRPKEKFLDIELKAIDSFLMNGGSLFIMADGVNVDQSLTAVKNDIGLNKILESYGVKLNNNLVMDSSSGMASFFQGFMTFSINYPFWPKVIKQDFDQNNAAVAKLESLVLPWASSLDLNLDKVKGDKISILAKTTDQAQLQSDNFNLSPQANNLASGKDSQYNLALSVFGKFNSAFNQGSTDKGRLIVVGDSDFIMDNFLNNSPDNLVFFQNLVDSLSLDEDLINIRSKAITERPIKELSLGVKATVTYANIFGLTLIVIIFGTLRYFLRRRRRFADQF